jgi:hypothetical protein
MPHKVAMELLLLGREISVKRAYDVGFVNKVVPLGEERKEGRRMAKIIAESAPLVIRTLRDFANQTCRAAGRDLRARALQARAHRRQRGPQGRRRRLPRRNARRDSKGRVGHGRSLLVGCGKMGGAMLEGWLARGLSARMSSVAERSMRSGHAHQACAPSPRPPTWPRRPRSSCWRSSRSRWTACCPT